MAKNILESVQLSNRQAFYKLLHYITSNSNSVFRALVFLSMHFVISNRSLLLFLPIVSCDLTIVSHEFF